MVLSMDDINTLDKLNAAIESSKSRPLLLFKHSLTCPISARALREVTAYIDDNQPDIQTGIVIVQQSGEVSSQAASLLGIQHESPQVILIKNRMPMWDISHFKITREALKATIDSHCN